MGYPPNQKAYKVFDLESKKLIRSRDITFYEKHLPFHFEAKNQTINHPIFFPINTNFDFETDFSIPKPFLLNTDTNSNQCSSSASQTLPETTFNKNPEPPQNTSPSITNLEAPQNTPPTSTVPQPRHSDRTRKKPSYLDNYLCVADSSSGHRCNIVYFDELPAFQKALINMVDQATEPASYFEASHDA